MTPKEKAEEFITKFYPRATSYSSDRKNQNENAKQCALIAVDEIILANPYSNTFKNVEYSSMDYWKEVKQEIEKL
jgi:hypothetical protein